MVCGCQSVTKNRLSYSGIYLLKASQIWISDIDLIMMLRRIDFLVVLVCFLAVVTPSSADLCEAKANCTLEEWKENILCRLNGGSQSAGSDAQFQNGYIQWAYEINPAGSSDRKNKFFAMVSLVMKYNVLIPCFLQEIPEQSQGGLVFPEQQNSRREKTRNPGEIRARNQ